jgi:adenylate cyclase
MLLSAAVACAGVGLALLAYTTDALRSLELAAVDARFSVRGTERPPPELVVVGVDTRTFETLGDERWPFRHDEHAALVDTLRRDGAKVIAFDIQFSEPSDTDKETLAFVDAVARAGSVVLAASELDHLGNGNVFTYIVPDPVLESRRPGSINDFLRRDVGVEPAYANLPNDPGGVLRRMFYSAGGLKGFAVAVAEKATGRVIDPSSLGGETPWIDYYGPPGTIPEVSYGDVRTGRTKRGLFRDKIVVIGATAQNIHDLHPTSTSGDAEMAGPEVQAHAIGTVLRGFPLKDTATGWDVALIVLLGLVAPAAGLRVGVLLTLAIALFAGAAYVALAQLAFNEGKILPVLYPLGALVLTAAGAVLVHYLSESTRTREMFARFVPETVVGQMLAEGEGARLGAVAREATVMFSDLRGFTSFAETLAPDDVMTILNRYLTGMVDDAIIPHGGTLVDYMGDGIMAVFGAPVSLDDHADRALAAARAKLRELEKFNAWLRWDMGFEKSFRMGIGLSSGRVMSGNVGSERLAYTVIGDTTNTAARLEAMTKGTEHMLFIAEATRQRLSGDPADLVFVDELEVRGRQQRVRVWSITGARTGPVPGDAFESTTRAGASRRD